MLSNWGLWGSRNVAKHIFRGHRQQCSFRQTSSFNLNIKSNLLHLLCKYSMSSVPLNNLFHCFF